MWVNIVLQIPATSPKFLFLNNDHRIFAIFSFFLVEMAEEGDLAT